MDVNWGNLRGKKEAEERLYFSLQPPDRRLWPGEGQALLPGNRRRGKNLRSHQGRFRLDIRKDFFTKALSSARRGCPGKRWSHHDLKTV